MRATSSAGWCLAAILVAALVLRLGAAVWWEARLPPGKKFGFGDSEGYWELARTIARGQPYEYNGLKIFRTPGYPAVLAPLFWMRDEPAVLWARVLGAVLSTAAVAGVAWLGWLLFDGRTALLAATIAAVYPEAIAAGAFVLSEAPFTPLMILQMVCWTLAWRSIGLPQRCGWSVAGGVVAGLATLMRPSWLLFLPFAGLIGLVACADRRKHVLITALMLAGCCLTMSPWWIRNYQVAGRFVPTSLQVGASLYDGLSPTATGASDMRFVPEFIEQQQAADAEAGAELVGLFEDRLDQRMRDSAVQWARENPGSAVQLSLVKFARMWNFLPNATEFQSNTLRLILAATYTPVILLGLVGLWRFSRRDWPYLLCMLAALYFTGLHIIFVASIRYRQPAMLPLIVLAVAVLIRSKQPLLNPEP